MKKLSLAIACGALATAGLVATALPSESEPAVAPHQDMHVSISTSVGQSHASIDYDWPSGEEVPVLREFSVGPANWTVGHRGVDLALAAGHPVRASADGTTIYAGRLNDRELVSIEHADGIRTTYEPIVPTVRRGQSVVRGEIIGHVDGTHCAPFSCLHWGAKRGSDGYLDPLSLLVTAPIRLYE